MTLAALLTWAVGCSITPESTANPTGQLEIYTIQNREIVESSGLVRSRQHPDLLWTHNDSGDRPRIFAISTQGRAVAEFSVEGAGAVDWEDIAIDDAGHLYLADIGNNENERRDLTVYRITEPDPAGPDRAVRVDLALRYRYADQKAYPQQGHSVFDAEAVFWRDDSLYILTKHRTDTRTTLYRLPVAAFDGERVLSPIAELDLGWTHPRIGNVTAADVTPDGRTLALLTYRHLELFEVKGSGDELELRRLQRIELDPEVTRQAEAVCWDGKDLILGNEQKRLFRISDPLSGRIRRYPPD